MFDLINENNENETPQRQRRSLTSLSFSLLPVLFAIDAIRAHSENVLYDVCSYCSRDTNKP